MGGSPFFIIDDIDEDSDDIGEPDIEEDYDDLDGF